MGNKLVLGDPSGSLPTQAGQKRDSILRLWADLFNVREDSSSATDLQWFKITEDVVPVNVSCSYEDPQTVYTITAYNSQVEKICDARVIQPGTKLKQPAEHFIHLTDSVTGKPWGFNFTSVEDASRFRDTCLTLSSPRVTKSSSFGTVRTGTAKKWKAGSQRTDVTKRSETHDGALASLENPPTGSNFNGLLTMPKFRQRQTRADSREIFDAHSRDELVEQLSRSKYDTTPKEVMEPPQVSLSHPRVLKSKSSVPLIQSEASKLNVNRLYQRHSSYDEHQQSPDTTPLPYDRPATLNSSHLRAILYSREDLLAELDREDNQTIVQSADVTVCNDQTIVEQTTLNTIKKSNRSLVSSTPSKNLPLTDIPSDDVDSSKWPTPPTPDAFGDSCSTGSDLEIEFDPVTLQRMLQSLPSTPSSSSAFGLEAEPGDTGITAPLPALVKELSPTSTVVLRKPSARGSRASQEAHNKRHSEGSLSTDSSSERILIEYELQLRKQCAQEAFDNEFNATIYSDSGFGGTVSTDHTHSIVSGSHLSRNSATYNRMSSGGYQGIPTCVSSGSIHSSSSSSQQTQSELTRVQPFTLKSDQSDSDSAGSITTLPAVDNYYSLVLQSGATRKTGWLEVKNWLIHSKRKAVLANKRSWKRYWVRLRGTSLMFFSCDDPASLTDEAIPRHIILIRNSLAQSLPEHPKREHIFSVSSAFGDAYLFQAPSQIEHNNWIAAIHSASAAQFSRELGMGMNTPRVHQAEINKLQENIDRDTKMKKMAELQLTTVKDAKSRVAIMKQISTWEENLESLHMDQYRFKCYLASMQGSELPNPKTLLTNMSRQTKYVLSKLGVLNVTSFHSLICARTPNAYNLYMGKTKKKGIIATLTNRQSTNSKVRVNTFVSPSNGSDEGDEPLGDRKCEEVSSARSELNVSRLGDTSRLGDNLTRVHLPNDQSILVAIDAHMTVQNVLELACNRRQFIVNDSFIRVKQKNSVHWITPKPAEILSQMDFDTVEVCAKVIFQVELERTSNQAFGIELEAELADNSEREDELLVFIGGVQEGSIAEQAYLLPGDEILTLNSKVVSDLDLDCLESLLAQELSICLTVRSSRMEKPPSSLASLRINHADAYIDNMMCPPPPTQSRISDRVIDDLIVPAPGWVRVAPDGTEICENPSSPRTHAHKSVTNIKGLLMSAEQVTQICRMANERPEEQQISSFAPPFQPLSESQKLRKIILELVTTEKAYVKDLSMLMERYLEPLKEETFLSSEEVTTLVGNIQEIVHFQRNFLRNLEDAVDDPSFLVLSKVQDFKNVLFSIAGSFLCHASHFKLYSSFCASHSRAQKVLSPGDNSELKEFLHARNPKQQHSATLESYLIKPIQRILKYPLLLRQLQALTDPSSDEFTHLSDSLKAMESVAEHINEMQRIYEEYGSVFDKLMKTGVTAVSAGDNKKPEIHVGDLEYHDEVEWLNTLDDVSRPRKGFEYVSTAFVFKHGVVFLCQEKLKEKPKKQKGGTVRSSVIDPGPDPVYTKFLPVGEIQVRTIPTAHAQAPVALWEIIHLKSAVDGRQEKIYHLASRSVDSRSEFLKHIRQIIRESVRKMTVPKKARDERLRQSVTAESSLTSGEMRSKQDNRFSMNLDIERVMDSSSQGSTRSRTYADLVELSDTGITKEYSSKTSINSDASQGSGARLVHSSHDPLTYSSKGSLDNDLVSPVWQKRSDSSSNEDLESAFLYPGSVQLAISGKSLKFPSFTSATEC